MFYHFESGVAEVLIKGTDYMGYLGAVFLYHYSEELDDLGVTSVRVVVVVIIDQSRELRQEFVYY